MVSMMSITTIAPLCSIIVPLFNKEQTIRACLDSVRAQTISSVEILVVDDGSTDGSVAIVEEVAREDDRVILMQEPNGGPAFARNVGLGTAIGQYVCFLDADDQLAPGFLETLIELMRREHTDSARCAQLFVEVNADDTPVNQQVRSITDRNKSVPGSQLYHRMFTDLEVPLMPAHSALYKRELLLRRKLCFNEALRHLEDVLFVATLYTYDLRIALSNQALYIHQHQADRAFSQERSSLTTALPPFVTALEALESGSTIATTERQMRLRFCAIVVLAVLSDPPPKDNPLFFRDFLRSEAVVRIIAVLQSRHLPNTLLMARALARLDYPQLLNAYCAGLARTWRHSELYREIGL